MDLSVLASINQIGACDFTTEKLSSLEENKKYRVLNIRALDTCFGRRIVVKLESIDGHVYLPERFKALADEEVELLSTTENLNLIYKGKKTLHNGRQANEVEFIIL